MKEWTQSKDLEILPICLNTLIFQDQPLILESSRQEFKKIEESATLNLTNQCKRPSTELHLIGLPRPGSSYTVTHSNISLVANSRLSRHALLYIATTLSRLLWNVLSKERTNKNPALTLAWSTIFLRCFSGFEGEKKHIWKVLGTKHKHSHLKANKQSLFFLVLISYSVIDSSKTILHRWTPLTLLTETAGYICVCIYKWSLCIGMHRHTLLISFDFF